MHPYPHNYIASVVAQVAGPVNVASPELPSLETAPPPEFDGPGGTWSPETLLCASLADCFVLTFRAVARTARLAWTRLECRVEGVLERVDRIPQFTHYKTFASLMVPGGTVIARARELLERAERSCLIANSVHGSRTLEARVVAQQANGMPAAQSPH